MAAFQVVAWTAAAAMVEVEVVVAARGVEALAVEDWAEVGLAVGD